MLLQFISCGGQRDRLPIERVAQLQGKIFAQRESEPRGEAQRWSVRNEISSSARRWEEVETERHAVTQEIGLGVRQLEATGLFAVLDDALGILPCPSRLRSPRLSSAMKPSVVEYPPAIENSPVGCSSTSTLTTIRSGAEPGSLVIFTDLK